VIGTLRSLILDYDPEAAKLREFVRAACPGVPGSYRVLDIGCGFGRNLTWLREDGYDAVGLEISQPTAAIAEAAGLPVIGLEQFRSRHEMFDLLLFSHVIEHLAPATALQVMDSYLDRLKPAGHVLIATPLLSPYFFDDFDHIKPYHPAGILAVYGGHSAQVGSCSPHRLELRHLWYRRSYYRCSHVPGRFIPSVQRKLISALELASASVFRLSGGLCGRKDAWVGLFRKV
jgi:SAM-dependent methyltransferase